MCAAAGPEFVWRRPAPDLGRRARGRARWPGVARLGVVAGDRVALSWEPARVLVVDSRSRCWRDAGADPHVVASARARVILAPAHARDHGPAARSSACGRGGREGRPRLRAPAAVRRLIVAGDSVPAGAIRRGRARLRPRRGRFRARRRLGRSGGRRRVHSYTPARPARPRGAALPRRAHREHVDIGGARTHRRRSHVDGISPLELCCATPWSR